MSVVIPPHLITDATRGLAWSALPDAPVEPDDPPRGRVHGFLRDAFKAVFRKQVDTTPAQSAPGLRPQTERC